MAWLAYESSPVTYQNKNMNRINLVEKKQEQIGSIWYLIVLDEIMNRLKSEGLNLVYKTYSKTDFENSPDDNDLQEIYGNENYDKIPEALPLKSKNHFSM